MRRTIAQFFCWQRQSAAASAGDPSRATPNPHFAGCRHRLAPKCHSAGIAAHSRPRRSGSRDSGGQQDGTDATEAARSLSGPGPRPQRSGWLRPPYNFIVEGGKGARLERRARRGTGPAARASGNIGSAQPYNGTLCDRSTVSAPDRFCPAWVGASGSVSSGAPGAATPLQGNFDDWRRRPRGWLSPRAACKEQALCEFADGADGAQVMADNLVIIAGGGIGGLATALTLHQIGVPCIVFEAVPEMRPLGVGINLQPNAVRELYDLGLTANDLDRVGLPAREWALVGLNGNDIYAEPRGLAAGYNWPQYAVHRGRFHMLLHEKLLQRIGPDSVRLGGRLTGYRKNCDGSVNVRIEHACERRGPRRAADWLRWHPFRGQGANAPRAAANPLGRGGNVARHDLGKTDTHGRFIRRPRHASSADRLLPHLPSRAADGGGDDQLDRRGDDGQCRGLEAARLVPAGEC